MQSADEAARNRAGGVAVAIVVDGERYCRLQVASSLFTTDRAVKRHSQRFFAYPTVTERRELRGIARLVMRQNECALDRHRSFFVSCPRQQLALTARECNLERDIGNQQRDQQS